MLNENAAVHNSGIISVGVSWRMFVENEDERMKGGGFAPEVGVGDLPKLGKRQLHNIR